MKDYAVQLRDTAGELFEFTASEMAELPDFDQRCVRDQLRWNDDYVAPLVREFATTLLTKMQREPGQHQGLVFAATTEHANHLERVFAPVMNLNAEFPFRLQPADTLLDNGSDNASFTRANVPAFLWGQSGDLARYSDTHHTQHDTFDRAIPEYQEHSAIVVALFAFPLFAMIESGFNNHARSTAKAASASANTA